MKSHYHSKDHVKHSMQGRLAAATQKQSAEYLKPLFKLLRTRVRYNRPCHTLLNFSFVTDFTFGHVGTHCRNCVPYADATIPACERFVFAAEHW